MWIQIEFINIFSSKAFLFYGIISKKYLWHKRWQNTYLKEEKDHILSNKLSARIFHTIKLYLWKRNKISDEIYCIKPFPRIYNGQICKRELINICTKTDHVHYLGEDSRGLHFYIVPQTCLKEDLREIKLQHIFSWVLDPS